MLIFASDIGIYIERERERELPCNKEFWNSIQIPGGASLADRSACFFGPVKIGVRSGKAKTLALMAAIYPDYPYIQYKIQLFAKDWDIEKVSL